MKLQILNCFCSDDSGPGNPAAVVIQFIESKEDKQTLAKKLNLPVTVFLSDADSSQPTLEYFYPDSQMPLCLHGTIGAAKVLFDLDGSCTRKLKTKSGLLLEVIQANEIIQVKVFRQSLPKIEWKTNDMESNFNDPFWRIGF